MFSTSPQFHWDMKLSDSPDHNIPLRFTRVKLIVIFVALRDLGPKYSIIKVDLACACMWCNILPLSKIIGVWVYVCVCICEQTVEMILDHCSGALMSEVEGLGVGMLEMDQSVCKASGETPGGERWRTWNWYFILLYLYKKSLFFVFMLVQASSWLVKLI